MKKLISLIVVSCFLSIQAFEYAINGFVSMEDDSKASELEDSKVSLIIYKNHDYYSPLKIDSTVVCDGKFFLIGQFDSVITAGIFIYGKNQTWTHGFLLEKGESVLDVQNSLMYGTQLNNFITEAKIKRDSIEEYYEKIGSGMEKAMDSLYTSIVKENNNSISTGYILNILGYNDIPSGRMEELYEISGEEIKSYPPLKHLIEGKRNRQTVGVGYRFVDISDKDSKTGDNVKLSDYMGKGRYVVLFMWASWCPWCKPDFAYLSRFYEVYGGENLNIVGVAVKSDWEECDKFLSDNNIIWPHVYDINDEFWTRYGINGAPYTFITDPEGIIISRHLRMEELEKELKLLLNK